MAWIVKLPPIPATPRPAGTCAIETEPPSAPADIYPTKAEALSVKRAVERGEHVAYSDQLSPDHARCCSASTSPRSGGPTGTYSPDPSRVRVRPSAVDIWSDVISQEFSVARPR